MIFYTGAGIVLVALIASQLLGYVCRDYTFDQWLESPWADPAAVAIRMALVIGVGLMILSFVIALGRYLP